MQKKISNLMLAFVLSMLWLPLRVWADDTNTVLQQQFGRQDVTVATDQEITFYDWKGTSSIASTGSNNAHSMTVFKPAEAGYSIQITFETCDIRNDDMTSTKYPGVVRVYNGVVDDSSFTWATSTYAVSNTVTLPDGNVLKDMDGTYTDETFYGSGADGALSVAVQWKYAKACDGWVAKVKCVKLEDMKVSGAGSDYSCVSASPIKKHGVALASAFVTATGVINADHLTSVSFKLAKNEDMLVAPLELKLYKGNKADCSGETPLNTTVSQSGDTYTFALDQELGSGTNYFTIAGDFSGSAPVGAKVQVDVTGVTTTAIPLGVQPFAAATSVEVANPAIVEMQEGSQTITVSDTPISFYDDGGMDGKATASLNGQTTFVPGIDGKKVMIDFSMVDLFESSLGLDEKSQRIKVYNGTTADEANLIATVKKGSTPKLRSTSADGALTVVFAGGSECVYTGEGFAAQVSLFTPQAMQVNTVAVTHPSAETLAAGDTDQQILKFNVNTENTEPALTTRKFSFNSNGTSSRISRATLYYTKANDTFATSTKVGETVVVADEFEISSASDIQLSEGDNFFWLTVDVADEALNDETVDAQLTTLTLSDGVHSVENGNPDGCRKVDNIVYSYKNQGSVTKNVNTSITFKTKSGSSYGNYYEGGTDTRTNVFLPKHEGMVCQIDFSEFDVSYSSSSYGTKAKFKVYEGQGTEGKLLWELASSDDQKTGPAKTLRSSSADGALTVVFSPNSSSNYSSMGFVATVSEYQPKAMVVEGTETSQASKDIASVGEKNIDILTLNVKTSGMLEAKTLNNVLVNLKGNESRISKLSLYNVEKADASVTAEPLATVAVDATSTTATLQLDSVFKLSEGDNFFRLQADAAETTKSGDVIDAAITSINISGEAMDVVDGDPDGEVIVKNIYVFKAGDNGEVLVSNDQPIMFYDDGGLDGNYTKNFEGIVTFAPKTPGESVKLTFNDWQIQGYSDKFNIYNGGAVKETADATYSRYDSPKYFVSTSEDGKVTVKFTTTTTGAGFAIEVSAYKKVPLYINKVTTKAVAPVKAMKGETDVQMVLAEVNVEGDLESVDINKIFFAAADPQLVSSVSVYATDTTTTYAPTHLLGKASADASAVDVSYKITRPDTYRLWLAYDIKSDATVGSAVEAKITAINDSIVAEPTTSSVAVAEGVSGTFTVGAGADYGTIQAAVDALKGGISGPVTINIKRGIYNEKVNVPEIAGASQKNTITIQSESGNWNDVKIYYDLYEEPAYSDDKMSAEYGVFSVSGADWLTLRGLQITTTDLTFPGVLHVKNMSRHLTVDSCYIHTATSESYSEDINLIYTYSKNLANHNNDYLTVRNSLLEGGYIGVRMGGTGNVNPPLPKEVGGVIENCTLRNQGTKAIYCMDELGAKLRGNRIENNVTSKDFYGFDGQLRDDYDESMEISGNYFELAISRAEAISLRQMKGTANAPVLVVNNEININTDNNSSFGIKIGSPASNLNIANNTVRLKGVAPSSTVMYVNDTDLTNVNIVNNVFQNEAGGYAYRYYKTECIAKPTYECNVASTTGSVFAYDKTDLADYEAWNAVANETAGLNDSISFISEDILEPLEEGNIRTAKPLDYVKEDIAGIQRDAKNPTIGAYEFNASTEAPVMAVGFPTITNITDSTAQLNVKADMAAILRVVVKEAELDAPTADEVLADTTLVTVRKNQVAYDVLDSLEKDKEYIAYMVLTSMRGTSSAVIKSSKFMAGGEVIVEIPAVNIVAEAPSSVDDGQTALFKATVSDGTAPFTVTLKNGKQEEVATAQLEVAGETTLEYAPEECDIYYMSVVDANGKTAQDTCRLVVLGEAKTATFENIYLDSESFWNGPDTKGNIIKGAWGDYQYDGSTVSGSYQFSNNYSIDWGSWTGFALSNRTATNFSQITPDQYNSYVGHGYDNSENYAVGYDNGTITVLNNAEGDTIRGMYVTSEAWAAECVKNGNGLARKFVEGDYLKVVFTGTRADGTESTVDYYLADYRSSKEADRYLLDTWQWVDLRSLGKVKTVKFSFDGTDKSAYGLNTSTYFCLDNVNGERVISETPLQTAGGEVDLSQFFTFDDATATVSYSFADELDSELAENVSLSTDGKLSVKNEYYKAFNVVVSATQRGKIQFLRVPFSIATGLNGVDNGFEGNNVAERYNINGQKLSNTQKGVNIIRTTDGKTRKVAVK